jgi:hypothetical protein
MWGLGVCEGMHVHGSRVVGVHKKHIMSMPNTHYMPFVHRLMWTRGGRGDGRVGSRDSGRARDGACAHNAALACACSVSRARARCIL